MYSVAGAKTRGPQKATSPKQNAFNHSPECITKDVNIDPAAILSPSAGYRISRRTANVITTNVNIGRISDAPFLTANPDPSRAPTS